MSDVMCCDDFVGSQTFHGSYVVFRVCIKVCIASHDRIENDMMWKRILLHLHRIHICMGLPSTHMIHLIVDSHEIWFHLEIEMKCN